MARLITKLQLSQAFLNAMGFAGKRQSFIDPVIHCQNLPATFESQSLSFALRSFHCQFGHQGRARHGRIVEQRRYGEDAYLLVELERS